MNVQLHVSRVGKAVVLTGLNGKTVLKMHMSSENAAQKKVDLILESQQQNESVSG